MDEAAQTPTPNSVKDDIRDAIHEYAVTYRCMPTRITLSRSVLKDYLWLEHPDYPESRIMRLADHYAKAFSIEGIRVFIIPGKTREIVCSDE